MDNMIKFRVISLDVWGCPWFWCNDEFSFAKMDHCISTLVDHFIDKYKEEIKQYCHSIVGEQ
jgi:hypothetical protein